MIYVEMYGRLGNQFFRYAEARALQEMFYPNEEITISFNQIDSVIDDPSWKNYLDDFNVKDYNKYEKKGKAIFNESSFQQKIIATRYFLALRNTGYENLKEQLLIENKYETELIKNGIYWFRNGFHKINKSNKKNKFVSGSFEDKRYFDKIREQLVKELSPKQKPKIENLGLYRVINNTNSVCVSIRRGDFVTDETIKKTHYVCNEQYFEKAISKIEELIENPTFIMFSDDIEWVRKNINMKGKTVFYESGKDPIWEKLRLMYSCKHFILSNSSFSWWAQYLSRNEKKIVVAPSRWYNNDFQSGLLEEKFIKINIEEK